MHDPIPERPPSDLLRQLQHYRLTTAEILYRLPDHPALLQSYVWQDYDLAPQYPILRKFLTFWERELDGPLYRVKVASVADITAGATSTNWRGVAAEFVLH